MGVRSTRQIGGILRDAAVFDFKNTPGALVNADSLLTSVDKLFALLEERRIDYVLVGGVALLTYVKGRNTQDIDLILSPRWLAQLPEIEISSQDEYFARGRFGELQVDLLLTRNPLFETVRQQHVTVKQFVERKVRCATVEGLLLLKLYALPSLYRQGSFAEVGIYENDIATLLHDYRPSLDPLFADLARHLSEADMRELRQIVGEIEARIERFRKGADTTTRTPS